MQNKTLPATGSSGRTATPKSLSESTSPVHAIPSITVIDVSATSNILHVKNTKSHTKHTSCMQLRLGITHHAELSFIMFIPVVLKNIQKKFNYRWLTKHDDPKYGYKL